MTNTLKAKLGAAGTSRAFAALPAALLGLALCLGVWVPPAFADAAEAEPQTDAEAAAPALADTDADEHFQPEPFVSIGWLIFLGVVSAFWIAWIEWVSLDSNRVGARQEMWNLIFFLTGLAGIALTVMTHPFFAVLTFLSMFVIGGAYIHQRNQIVTPDQVLFSRRHFSRIIARTLGKFGLKVSPELLEEIAGDRNDQPDIVLLRKDGKSLDHLSGEKSKFVVSEATMAVKEIIESAVLSRSTDIHLEPKSGELQVRFRIDGILHNVPSYPSELAPSIVSALKVLSDMDIADKRKPQDGTFMGKLEGKDLDFRVATSPTVHGETMVIRILDQDKGLLRLESLGLDAKRQEQLRRIINAPHGMLIVSGPTGSGKSTTLYASLLELDAFQKNIMTVENPIEYRLDNITQTQINPKAGVTFAGQLRSMLRQDPDVIMIGEIRDAETARTALQSAMTGHFVFTTLHANDSVSTLLRLLDLGVEPYLIGSSLTAVLAQRLVRVLCDECKQPYPPKPEFLKKVGLSPAKVTELYRAEGCEVCQGTGYRGRVGVYELFELNDAVRDMLRAQPSLGQLKAAARKAGLVSLQEDGLRKVVQGVTSVKELIRVTK